MRLLSISAFLFAAISTGFAQNAAVAPVPSSPYELATGPTRVLDETDQRASVLGLIERARQNSDLHAPGGHPFALKISFEASGDVSYTGSGQLEETWLASGQWRWSSKFGSYSQTRIMTKTRMFDENLAAMPLRLQMVRETIFWPIHMSSFAMLRISAGTWKGSPVMCVLSSGVRGNPSATVGRRWEESEFCIDTKSGLLQTYSVAPGIYAVYDYQHPIQFHRSTLPGTILIYEAGNAVLQIHLDNLSDAGQVDTKLFAPTPEMAAQGNAPVLAGQMKFPVSGGTSPIPTSGLMQAVVVHASINSKGNVEEAEALQNSDTALSAAALARVKNSIYPAQERGRPTQREAFISVWFAPAATAGQ